MADEVAKSLEERFKAQTPTPNSREYGNDSWALVQLYSFYEHRGDDEGRSAFQKSFVSIF